MRRLRNREVILTRKGIVEAKLLSFIFLFREWVKIYCPALMSWGFTRRLISAVIEF